MNFRDEEFEFQNAEVYYICEKEFRYSDSDDNDLAEAKYDNFIDPNEYAEDVEKIIKAALYYSDDPDDVHKYGKYMKVRDHCHLSGKYRGAAHKACNVNLQLPQNIHVFCHNMSSYDTHQYIKELAKKYRKIDLIANTDEEYINYMVNSGYRF